MKKIFLIISITLISAWCIGQENFENTLKYSETEASPKAKLQDLAWIAGHWKGKAMGGEIEEVWTPALGGSMMGSFKLVADGKVLFYELETITEENETLILRIKHFSDDLKGWEEKDETEDFKLVKLTEGAAYFDQLTFKKVGDDLLNIYIVIATEKGEEQVLFQYKRVK
ncbi:hypothetical protein G3O08_14750 [Cryomorpha ignava]|uniref:DUF6265 domain-containing protein n=1 Tax=Cryomorpha ignava TaxID=101383 RepID=A0A7K3WV19_9FLAO|nr:DUF6265 family protein [Cryomorpha ignava]NEN24762.1 hypothetical protein [Cryomorpha ignava]